MKAWCLSKRDFDLYCRRNGWKEAPPEGTAVISICCNPEVARKVLHDPDSHRYPDGLPNVLNVEFDDIVSDKETFKGHPDFDSYDEVTAYGITPETADRIVRFVEEHREDDFVIHCRAGKSRSQAVTRYITEFYPGHDETNPDNPCLFPNTHTHSALVHARMRSGL